MLNDLRPHILVDTRHQVTFLELYLPQDACGYNQHWLTAESVVKQVITLQGSHFRISAQCPYHHNYMPWVVVPMFTLERGP